MNELIRRYDATPDNDLMIAKSRGVAYQRDMGRYRVPYDEAYYQKCAGYGGTDIEQRIIAGRVAFVDRHYGAGPLVDIGIGSGAFVRARPETWGTDINPRAVEWLRERDRYADNIGKFRAISLWDVIEHVERPENYLRAVPNDGYLFCCLPIFDDLKRIRKSKHYRPGEHLYYFTEPGFIAWMAEYRFELLERAEHEIDAGREAILSFAFKKTLPGYHETIAEYRKMYEPDYGASSRFLYLDLIAPMVMKADPASILDYGCGRSDLLAHFWNDGRRSLAWYDPALPQFATMPSGTFDLVLCCDVMEHVRMEDVRRVLREIQLKGPRVLFVISLKPARAKLPDGRNAHVTLLSADEWSRWIAEVFGTARPHPTPWPHVLMLTTF